MDPSHRHVAAQTRRAVRDEQGSILLATVLAMLLLTVLALSLAMSATLEGKVAVNHYALVRSLHVADGGIEGVRKELTDYVNGLILGGTPWPGNWSAVLAVKSAPCNGSQVAFNISPTGGASWIRTGSGATLFLTDNDNNAFPPVTWENANLCTDTDNIVTVIADGRIPASAGAFGASQRIAVDLIWRDGGSAGGWDNAIQGGGPGGGALINGNAMVYGGVSLNAPGGGTVWNMGGTSGIRNNYQNGGGAPSSEQLRATTRALLNPALRDLGDVSLNARFLVDHGTAAFGGGATAGLAQGSTTGRKQTLDEALANDFDPATNSSIHADRTGTIASVAGAPLLSSIVGGGDTRTWEVMLNQDGLHITPAELTASCGGPCTNNVLDGYTGTPIPATTKQRFCVYAHMATPPPGPAGSTCTLKTTIAGTIPSKFDLVVDQAPNPNTATLSVQGLIVFDNYGTGTGIRFGGLNGGGPESLGEIAYMGSATIFIEDALQNNCTGAAACAGRLTVAADVVAWPFDPVTRVKIASPPAAYPTAVNPPIYPPAAGTVNNLAFMADRIGIARGADDSSISASNLTLTGLFYAQSAIFMCKQTETFGSLLSAQVNISCNVPKIAAVRTISKFLPKGLIGSDPSPVPGRADVVRWREVTRP